MFSSGAFLRVCLEESAVVAARVAAARTKKEDHARRVAAILGDGAGAGSKQAARGEHSDGAVAVGSGQSGGGATGAAQAAQPGAAAAGNGCASGTAAATAEASAGSDKEDEEEDQKQHGKGVHKGAPQHREKADPATLIAVVPPPDEIADVAAGMFGEMFDDVAMIQVCVDYVRVAIFGSRDLCMTVCVRLSCARAGASRPGSC